MDKPGIKLAWVFAASFFLAGVMGFSPNPVLGSQGVFVTNTAHNLVHLLTAVGFVAVALWSNTASVVFMKSFGAVYLMVGLAGFPVTGMNAEGMLLGWVHINALDNFLHLGLGAVILMAGICVDPASDEKKSKLDTVSNPTI